MTTPVSGAQSPAESTTEESLAREDGGEFSPRTSRTRNRIAKRLMVSDESDSEQPSTPTSTLRTRGRPRAQPAPVSQRVEKISASIVPNDALPEEVQVDEDELVLAHHDEEGERKVDDDGHLFGERKYRVRTFTILGRGRRLYMLSTEPARCMGYRDSYLFFLKHKTLHRVILDDNEKEDLAARELIPTGYRTRQIAICTARSVFREFGARIVVGGRRIIDDYWTKEYRKLRFEEGVLADPDDRLPPPGVEYNSNQFVAWHGASAVYHQQPHTERKPAKRVIDDVNWITAHAQATSAYNAELGQFRRRMLDGVHEAHTGQTVFPGISQPERCIWEELQTETSETEFHTIETRVILRPCEGQKVHLLDMDAEIFASASEEIKALINSRREKERTERSSTILSSQQRIPQQ